MHVDSFTLKEGTCLANLQPVSVIGPIQAERQGVLQVKSATVIGNSYFCSEVG